uniref:Family with sequence similarity 83 member G n=1 Tax=Scleropages formosus TaxID=113540 RepID=A0A8C9WI63_SCLFO
MALSQIQCLEDNHVNWRTNESKPEFFYSEEQRLALEALFRDGRGAFHDYVKEHKVRQFLSELELERLSRGVHAYQPGGERAEGAKGSKGAEGEDGAESLQYWPERSDTSVPDLEIGWPDCTSYRGVTRVNVYTQPPLDGSTHIKEVVRKTIAQAQKVIAVAMDLFTDVDIFKDLLDASFKRKVAVYMVLDTSGLSHFMDMCQRNLRVRTIAGSEFYTRSSTKVCGLMSQKFMFVDGDRAVSGSYRCVFTWTASRLDRNLITVLTGQAVDTFDKLFRDLYATSTGVNLSKLSLQDEPEPEPLPQLAPAPLPSAAVARKLINPKYALVASSGEKDEQKGVRIIEDNDGTDGKGLSSSDLPRKASFASTVSDECFESVYSDNMESSIQLMVNGVHTGSGRVEDHRHVDGLNVMARFSQSMLDLRPESQQQLEEKEAENPQALGDIHAALEHNQRQLHKAGERKVGFQHVGTH